MNEWMKRFRASERTRGEDGFTLMELAIVLVVIALLASIIIPIYFQQQRLAIVAGIKSDLANNAKTSMVAPAGQGRLYATWEQFRDTAVITAGNVAGYLVNEAGDRACLFIKHDFGYGDVAVWHYDTDTSVQAEGFCPDLDAPPPPASEPEETPTPTPTPEVTPTPDVSGNMSIGEDDGNVSQMAGLLFDVSYSPQNNLATFCYKVVVSIDYSHPLNVPTAGSYEWAYTINTQEAPFYGLNPATDLNSAYGYATKEMSGSVWTVRGEGWNNTISGSTGNRTFGFCAASVPIPPVDPSKFEVSITPKSGNSNYWACLVVKVTTDSVYPVSWSAEVDLTAYFKSIGSTTPQFTNLNRTSLGGQRYVISGQVNNNLLVAASMPRTSGSETICYNPNGQPW
jgi:prepilin-type N-terminal cleavage/methylation domain-containing protein